MITKNMTIVAIMLLISAAGLYFEFDVFKVYAVAGFFLALDCQLIASQRSRQTKKIMEALNEAAKRQD
jgi:hypothetical protein